MHKINFVDGLLNDGFSYETIGITPQNTVIFIATAMRTSNLT
jgi:hypothetical protein